MAFEPGRERLDVEATVEMYVAARVKSRRPVSTGDAIKAIRTAMPACELDDRALADLVAGSAIRSRQNVIFDPPDESSS
jgi:hypothetical protein